MRKNYKLQAKKLYDANFRMYGIGNFDVYIDEVSNILEAIDKKDYKFLSTYYEELEKQRMG